MSSVWNDICQFISNMIDQISKFLDWYMNDTPLFNETLDSIAEWSRETYRIAIPIIGDYIKYLSEYFNIGG